MKKNDIILSEKCDFKTYLSNLNHSYFSICPEGNGIDTHRIWESLYLKTVPIVTKSINIEFYKNYPILIIDDWNSFDLKDITISLYNEIIKKYNEKLLDIGWFYEKIITL